MRLPLLAAALCLSTGACVAQPYGGPQQYAQADQQPSGPPPGYAGWGSYGQQGAGQQPPQGGPPGSDGGPPPGYAGQPPQGGPGGPPPSGPPGPPGAVGPNGHLHGEPRFEAANVTHDGRLTLDQARAAHWMMVAHNFARIDRDQKGYVTWQDIRDFQRELHAERQQQRGAAPGAGGPPPGYSGQPPQGQGAPPPGYGGQPGGPPPDAPPPGQQY